MVHHLTVGHLDPNSVGRHQWVPTKALEMDVVRRLLDEIGEKDAGGSPTLGGCKVEFGNGYVCCPWLRGGTNRVAEEFALRMQREIGCLIADVNGDRVTQPRELAGLNGQMSAAQGVKRPAW